MKFEFVNHWTHTWGKKAWKDFFRNDHFIALGIQWGFGFEFTLFNFGLKITGLPKKTPEYRKMEIAERERSPKTNDKDKIIKVPKLKPLV